MSHLHQMYHREGVTDLNKMQQDAIRTSAGDYGSKTAQATEDLAHPVLIHHHDKDDTCEVGDGVRPVGAQPTQGHEFYKDGVKQWAISPS